MKNRKIIIDATAIGLVLLMASVLFFSQPPKTQAANPCKKNFYANSDIVGYFRDVEKDDSYYITNDWCVVKAILWWGSVFEHYSPIEDELNSKIVLTGNTKIIKLLPEPQVYFGLIPEYFLKANKDGQPRKGVFCTVGLKQYGYLINDDAFKNIYGNNYPQPPKFVNDEKICNDGNTSNQIAKPPAGSLAELIMKGMHYLHTDIFALKVAKGGCQNQKTYSEIKYYCDYFKLREQQYIPSPYKAFTKKIGFTSQ